MRIVGHLGVALHGVDRWPDLVQFVKILISACGHLAIVIEMQVP